MPETLLSPNTCGFAKVVVLQVLRKVRAACRKDMSESNTRYKARLLQEEYKQFTEVYTEGQLQVDFSYFNKHLPAP